MARIRTIKPEFPQSESMGNVSRDARLTFMLLWTLADDEGRLRGNSRMLASLLFPYDDDAPSLIDGWLSELEREDCIIRYKVEGTSYLQVCKWLIHQKIDKPSKSKIPPPEDDSRILANPRESSCLDQGSRIKDQGKDQGPRNARGVDDFDADIPELHKLPKPQPQTSVGNHPLAGEACKAIKATGIGLTNPSHPKLNALLHAGVTIEQLVGACESALKKQKTFSYALAIAEREAEEARGLSEKLSAPVKPAAPDRYSPEFYADQPPVQRI